MSETAAELRATIAACREHTVQVNKDLEQAREKFLVVSWMNHGPQSEQLRQIMHAMLDNALDAHATIVSLSRKLHEMGELK